MAKRKTPAPAPEDTEQALQSEEHTLPDTEEVRQYINVHQGIVGLRAYLESIQPKDAHHEQILKETIRQVESYSNYLVITAEKLGKKFQELQPIYDDIEEMESLIMAELIKANPDLAGQTIDEFLDRYTLRELMDLSRDPDSFLSIAMDAARRTKAATETVTSKRAESVEYPTDKPNSEIWNLFSEDPSGQLSYMIDMYPDQPKTAGMLYSIDFDALSNDAQISKRLEPFDKRVYIAVSALYNANKNRQGIAIINLTQIYYAMGYTGKPGDADREKINNSLTKMTGARIYIDNADESKLLKGYPHFKYDASLLPMERGTMVINGQLTEAAVKLRQEPPMISFAKDRRQVTTIPVTLLQSPNSKTNANLQIEDYLLERISRAKNAAKKAAAKNKKQEPAEQKEKILLQTLYDRAEITTAKQIQRAPAKIKKYLDYYRKQGYITRYAFEPNSQKPKSLTIYF